MFSREIGFPGAAGGVEQAHASTIADNLSGYNCLGICITGNLAIV